MTEHLIEAIQINWRRSKLYSKLSNGRSHFVSIFLISSETLTLPLSLLLDCIAKFWQWRGVPVLVHEFIPMDETPDYKDSYPDDVLVSEQLPDYKFEEFYRSLWDAFKTFQYSKMSEAFELAMKPLENYPGSYCMLRHLLESGLRCANLAEKHVETAHEKNVASPHWFCLYLIFTHILPLKLGLYLDKKAHAVQKEGIPIIYQDVPAISPFPESY